MNQEVKVDVLFSDDVGRHYIDADEQLLDNLYMHNVLFWKTRFQDQLSEEAEQHILGSQTVAENPFKTSSDERLLSLYTEGQKGDGFSMLEIGAANGTVIDRIAQTYPDPQFRYVGFECLPLLVKDFNTRHPGKVMHLGAIEDFLAMDTADFEQHPFTVFYTSVALVMIKPSLVREAILKAARFSEHMLFFDYIEVPPADLQPGHSLVVHMPNRPVFWFTHPWKDLMDEIGFEIIDLKAGDLDTDDPRRNSQLRGFGMLHAKRA
jgi:hypothetical protein